MWPSPFHNTWESDEDFLNESIPQDQFHPGTYWDDTWISPPGQWYEPGSALQEPIVMSFDGAPFVVDNSMMGGTPRDLTMEEIMRYGVGRVTSSRKTGGVPQWALEVVARTPESAAVTAAGLLKRRGHPYSGPLTVYPLPWTSGTLRVFTVRAAKAGEAFTPDASQRIALGAFGDATWEDVADEFGGMSEDERFEMDEDELGRRRRRGRGRRSRRRPRIVILPGGREEKMDEVIPNRRNPNKGVVRVAVKTGFPHQVERRAVKRAKRVLKSKGYQGVETKATIWFPIITPVGPIPYNYKGYTPVRVHFSSSGMSAPSAPSRGRGRSRAPVEEDYYEDEPMQESAPESDFPEDVTNPGGEDFDAYFGVDLLDSVDHGNEFLD